MVVVRVAVAVATVVEIKVAGVVTVATMGMGAATDRVSVAGTKNVGGVVCEVEAPNAEVAMIVVQWSLTWSVSGARLMAWLGSWSGAQSGVWLESRSGKWAGVTQSAPPKRPTVRWL